MPGAFCTCGHPSKAHEDYKYGKHIPRPCLLSHCECRAFDYANRKWKYNKNVDAFEHPYGVVRAIHQIGHKIKRTRMRGLAHE